MSHACHLIASAIPERDRPALPRAPVEGLCAVTGTRGPCIPRGDVISDSNCDAFLFAAPASPVVHADVFIAWTFGDTKPGKKMASHPERQACWYCDGREFRIMNKVAMRPIVLDGSPASPWAMWVTTSYKKHGSVRSPVNAATRGRVGFDEIVVDCTDAAAVADSWARLRAAQDAGIPRPLIETLDIAPAHMAKLGWRVWREFETWARPRLRSPLYALLTYLLPSQEELRERR
jgi:hypothetical protein